MVSIICTTECLSWQKQWHIRRILKKANSKGFYRHTDHPCHYSTKMQNLVNLVKFHLFSSNFSLSSMSPILIHQSNNTKHVTSQQLLHKTNAITYSKHHNLLSLLQKKHRENKRILDTLANLSWKWTYYYYSNSQLELIIHNLPSHWKGSIQINLMCITRSQAVARIADCTAPQ